jgi:hypothetical protein
VTSIAENLIPAGDPRLYRILYLDNERVRSLAAMLFGGVPEVISYESASDGRTSGGIRAGFPGVAGAEITTETLFVRKQTETLAQHHFMLMAVISRLERLGRVQEIDSDQNDVQTGRFLRITGEIRIRVYAAVTAAMDTVGRLGLLSAKFRREAKRKEGGLHGRPTKDLELIQIAELEKTLEKDLPSLRDAIDAMFEGVIRIYCVLGARSLIGTLDRENMVERLSPGTEAFGPAGLWTILCEPDFPPSEKPSLPDLSGVEKSIEEMLDKMSAISQFSKPSNTQTIYPIAIYREL